MTNQNELTNVEVKSELVVRENDRYSVIQDAEGKFKRKAKYNHFSSIKAESRDDKIWMMNLLEGTEESGQGLKDHVGKHIEVANIITRLYDRINEETGAEEYGVLTYLITPDKVAYVTSSKSVYFSIIHIMEFFGTPNDADWKNIKIKVLTEKGANGNIIKIKMV